MAGQSDYLPPGLPFNRGAWTQEQRDLEQFDLRACGLIRDLFARKITRTKVLVAIEEAPEQYREHFKGWAISNPGGLYWACAVFRAVVAAVTVLLVARD